MGWMRVMLGLSFMLSRMIFEFFFWESRREKKKEKKKKRYIWGIRARIHMEMY